MGTTLCDKIVSDLRQVGGFHRVSGFFRQQNWQPLYDWNIVESGVKHHKNKDQTALVKIYGCMVL